MTALQLHAVSRAFFHLYDAPRELALKVEVPALYSGRQIWYHSLLWLVIRSQASPVAFKGWPWRRRRRPGSWQPWGRHWDVVFICRPRRTFTQHSNSDDWSESVKRSKFRFPGASWLRTQKTAEFSHTKKQSLEYLDIVHQSTDCSDTEWPQGAAPVIEIKVEGENMHDSAKIKVLNITALWPEVGAEVTPPEAPCQLWKHERTDEWIKN